MLALGSRGAQDYAENLMQPFLSTFRPHQALLASGSRGAQDYADSNNADIMQPWSLSPYHSRTLQPSFSLEQDLPLEVWTSCSPTPASQATELNPGPSSIPTQASPPVMAPPPMPPQPRLSTLALGSRGAQDYAVASIGFELQQHRKNKRTQKMRDSLDALAVPMADLSRQILWVMGKLKEKETRFKENNNIVLNLHCNEIVYFRSPLDSTRVCCYSDKCASAVTCDERIPKVCQYCECAYGRDEKDQKIVAKGSCTSCSCGRDDHRLDNFELRAPTIPKCGDNGKMLEDLRKFKDFYDEREKDVLLGAQKRIPYTDCLLQRKELEDDEGIGEQMQAYINIIGFDDEKSIAKEKKILIDEMFAVI